MFDLIVVAQSDFPGGAFADILADGRIMFLCRVYIFVSQHIGNHINILRFPIERRTVCGAQLMRRDLFQRTHDTAVLFDQ